LDAANKAGIIQQLSCYFFFFKKSPNLTNHLV
ncbi:MAG: hypothetical protein ACI9QR_002007, partial [Flavobacteriaceae bacterium]